MSNEFIGYCIKHGIKKYFYASRTPQKNRLVERRNRYIVDCVTNLLIEKGVAQIFQREVLSTIVYTLN